MPDTVLSLPASRLFGRDDELQLVAGLLQDSRLVTLTGAGGCGKTRLALTVATERRDQYDGICWADLAALTDPGLVPKAVSSALQLADRPGAEPVGWLIKAIADRSLLLVLDNCEHLIDACADLVSRMVRGCPRLTVLATSREALGVEGETSYRVPSLAVPPVDAPDVLHFSAVALFADRAAKAKPGFTVTDDNSAAIGEICRRLDGIPLAIELAAPRVRMMTPSQIASALGDRFQLLTGGVRTALPRQRTLEASVAWSYDLLTEEERWVLRQLTVFAGSFGLDLGLTVCAGGPPHVLDVLGRLVERSLLQVDDSKEVARYRLLETVRAYALTRLVDETEVKAARDRHLDAYVAFAEASEAGLTGPDLVAVLDAADAEVDNLRAAMDWAVASGQIEKALRIAGALWIYWFIRTRHGEGLKRLHSLLAATPDADPLLRYRVLMAPLLLSLANDWHGARPLAQEAVQIADAVGDNAMKAQAYAWLGQTQHQLDEADGGKALLRESLDYARASGDAMQLGRSLQWLGTVLGMTGEPDEGISLLDESIAMFRVGGVLQLGWALVWRGVVAFMSGDLAGAEKHLAEGHRLLVARHEDGFAAVAVSMLAHVSMLRGDFATAGAQLHGALEQARLSVTPMLDGSVHAQLALLAMARGDDVAAAAHAETSLEASASHVMMAMVLAVAGYAETRLGDLTAARVHLARAESLTANNATARVRVLWALAHLARATGDTDDALQHVHESLRLGVVVREHVVVIDALELLIQLLAHSDPAATVRLVGAVERGRSELGYVRFPSFAEDHEAAVRRLRDALGPDYDAAHADGAALSLEEAVAYAGRGRGPRGRPTVGWDSLTPTQRDVAALVAKGLSNPDIAAQLFISRNTVKAHLAQAYAKLGVANRSELAAEVSRRDLTQGAAQA